jgi:hypothetical protein
MQDLTLGEADGVPYGSFDNLHCQVQEVHGCQSPDEPRQAGTWPVGFLRPLVAPLECPDRVLWVEVKADTRKVKD